MIVVIGTPAWQPPSEATPGRAVGVAVEIARAGVDDGADVELVAKVGEDPAGESVMLDLARAGIGHAAVLRAAAAATPTAPPDPPADDGIPLDADIASLVAMDVEPVTTRGGSNGRTAAAVAVPSLALEPADLELALRYLVDFRVVVMAEPLSAGSRAVVSEAAAFAGAALVAVAPDGATADLPADATVFEPPVDDEASAFARLVGGYAAGLDRGDSPDAAFRAASVERGWEPAGP
ncbi:MAG TPA: hypothetical protein VEY67_06845 [Candidatus Dormibacteraeota bacterium]|nr:hypothetical protein [Candidatus Dormibacteraeota bacterium]